MDAVAAEVPLTSMTYLQVRANKSHSFWRQASNDSSRHRTYIAPFRVRFD